MTQPKSPQPLQQNGAPFTTGGNTPQPTLRPQFRRQGSSFGGAGHVHPMAVMVSGAPKTVDYSVTKGGLRVWAVIFMFLFMCTGMYGLFSATERTDIVEELDTGHELSLAPDVDDEAIDSVVDIPPSKPSPSGIRRTVTNAVEEKAETGLESRKGKLSPAADDDEPDRSEEGVDKDATEETLFASLKAKMEEKFQTIKTGLMGEDEDLLLFEEAEDKTPPAKQRKSRERKKRGGRDIEEEGVAALEKPPKKKQRSAPPKQPEPETVATPKPKKAPAKPKPQTKPVQIVEDVDDNEEPPTLPSKSKKRKDKKNMKRAYEDFESVDEEAHEETHDEEADEAVDDDDSEDVEQAGEPQSQPARPVPVCKRARCEPNIEPRKRILKEKPPLHGQKRRYAIYVEPDGDEAFEHYDEEEEDEEDGEQLPKPEPPVTEVASVVKSRPSGRAAYKRHGITNHDDYRHRTELDRADLLVERHDYAGAFAIFDGILSTHPDSARAHFGKARALDIRSEADSSNAMLDEAISEYQRVLEHPETPEALFRQAADRLINRARFRGSLHRALRAHRLLIDRFPDDLNAQNEFGLTFLMMNRQEEAKTIFRNVLQADLNNGYAAAYYGLILKTYNGDLEQSVQLMRRGIRTKGQELADARLYYHLGDGLMRLGKASEAYKIYEEAANLGLFLSKYQRSLNNVKGLTARPWWTMDQTTYSRYLRRLERQWLMIRKEALVAMAQADPERFVEDAKKLTAGTEFSAFYLHIGDHFIEEHCDLMPTTCDLLEEFLRESNASRGMIKLSLLRGGTRVWPHCGPTNGRLQAHLGLIVPSEARIRVADRIRGWKTGRFIVFDDSFEHELWFDGASANNVRLVLAMDLWHPEVPSDSRREFVRR